MQRTVFAYEIVSWDWVGKVGRCGRDIEARAANLLHHAYRANPIRATRSAREPWGAEANPSRWTRATANAASLIARLLGTERRPSRAADVGNSVQKQADGRVFWSSTADLPALPHPLCLLGSAQVSPLRVDDFREARSGGCPTAMPHTDLYSAQGKQDDNYDKQEPKPSARIIAPPAAVSP